MSLANQLTLLRLVAVVPVMIALALPFEWARYLAVASRRAAPPHCGGTLAQQGARRR
jgi:hypothetical protein